MTRPAFSVRLVGVAEIDMLDQVLALGDQNKRWLGLLTRVAFTEYAAAGKILVAVEGRQLLGYALFDLPFQRVRLAHLCVADSARRRGVARALVENLSRLHESRQGIVLSCRRDWAPASATWPKLGFTVLSNRSGRSRGGHELTMWWRDHGWPDLMSSAAADNPRLLVAMDTNVFRDLYETGRGDEADQSRALLAGWLEPEIELVLTPRNRVELNAHTDRRIRQSLLGTANSLHRSIGIPRPGKSDPADDLESRLLAAIPDHELARDQSLRTDARLLAEADAGHADAFVSRDENAVAILAAAASSLSDVWVSTPTDLIVHLDELRDIATYAPARLLHSGYSISEAEAKALEDLRPLISHSTGETFAQFRARVRDSAQYVGHSASRLVLRDPDGAVVAGAFINWPDHESTKTLTVSLLRVAPVKLAKTIAIQLLHVIRTQACALGVQTIAVTDPNCPDPVRATMSEMGYIDDSTRHLAYLLQGAMTWPEVTAALPFLTDGRVAEAFPSAREAAELERILAPLKITDAPIPCFMVPIRPAPSALLLNRQQMLFDEAELGLSRQHVYYRVPTPAILEAPGRILWYESGATKEVIAASRLEQVVVAHPGTLHRKFRRLGVLDRGVIDAQARHGKAMAVMFADTEYFDTPVPLRRLREIDRRLSPLPSPRRIPTTSFFTVYEEGNPA